MLMFPDAIEKCLVDAGLSPTEILILHHLMGEEMFTLRQLAAKTGKSTGVLDQAVKKLLRKNIINRVMRNDAPHYLLHSLQTISAWMKEDIRRKKDLIQRRHEDFVSFLSGLKLNRDRPEILHFEGSEGIANAYRHLLATEEKELLVFMPTTCREEDHPLCDFLRQWTSERRRRRIFLRVLTNDSPLGRRFQSRDPFEYRETVLLPTNCLPIPSQRIIAGGLVACFDAEEKTARFLQYPQLAEAERALFFSLIESHSASVPQAI